MEAPKFVPSRLASNEASFTRQHLKRLVEIGGAALELEDLIIRQAVRLRSILQVTCGGRPARFGIRRAKSEHYLQYLIWSALLQKFEFTVELERWKNDFLVWDCTTSPAKTVAVGEMKQWMDPGGNVNGIKTDIRKVRAAEQDGCRGFILIATASQVGTLDNELASLYSGLMISPSSPVHYRFESCFEGSTDKAEFDLLGFMASDSSLEE